MGIAILDSVDTRLWIDTVFLLVMRVWVPSLRVLLMVFKPEPDWPV